MMTTPPVEQLLPLAPVEAPELVIRVFGKPVQQGSMKPYTRGGKPQVKPDNEAALRPWRAAVAEATRSAVRASRPRWYRLDGPVTVFVDVFLPRPESAKTRRAPYKTPDIDKLARALLDGITDGGAVHDDSRICRLVAEKHYADSRPPGARVRVVNALVPVSGTGQGETP